MQRLLLQVVCPVAVGATIYLLWRPTDLLVFAWADLLGLGRAVAACRAAVASLHPLLPGPILNTLPDGLWVYAMTAALVRVWHDDWSLGAVGWVVLPLLLCLGGEFGQGFEIVPGTFDWWDVAIAPAAAAAATLRFRRSQPTSEQLT
jgi:hypothetical protein